METYPIIGNEGERLPAFEIENAYISPSDVAGVLAEVAGVTDIQVRRLFDRSREVHVQFKYLGQPYVVWEPWGDSSRYWIGPKAMGAEAISEAPLEDAFKRYRPSILRSIGGDIISLRFINRLFKRT
jgi:hypothetical protein